MGLLKFPFDSPLVAFAPAGEFGKIGINKGRTYGTAEARALIRTFIWRFAHSRGRLCHQTVSHLRRRSFLGTTFPPLAVG